MIPLYILGLLLRFGPQHGYQIKKLLAEQLEDFTQIKLPTIYYHLEKMEEAGMIISQNAKEGTRPEKKVYHVSESGCKRFRELLYRTIDIEYRPTFDVDAAFYFSDHIDIEDIIKSLQRHFERLEKAIEHIEEHRQQTLKYLPKDMKVWANIIFEHHLAHYQSELEWTKSSIRDVEEVCFDDED